MRQARRLRLGAGAARLLPMKLSTGTFVVLGILLLGAVTGGTAMWGAYLAQPGPLTMPTNVVISPGQGPRVMANKLAAAGVITHPDAFVLAVRLLRMDSTLKAGEYAFEPGISLRAVVNKLAMGDTQNRSVTIPEGWTVKQALERMQGIEGLTGLATRPEEGSIFPDTYAFRFGTERDKIIESMQERMKAELSKVWDTRDTSVPLKSPEELLILASIVQREAANEREMPQVAAVFINRLRTGMKLQSDPTVMYGAEQGGRLKRKDLDEPQPFNTYIYAGLPPTPISNPGKAALMAVAHPADIKALFFVADPSLTMHVFSDTYAEHVKNVQRYWKEVGKVSPSAPMVERALEGGRGVSVSQTLPVKDGAVAVPVSVVTSPSASSAVSGSHK